MAENTRLLIRSNFKKSRKTSTAFFLFIMLAVLLYHTGSQLTDGFRSLCRKKISETNSADFAATLPYDFCDKYRRGIIDFGLINEEVTEIEITDALLLRNATIQDGDGDAITGAWTFRNADRTESLSCLKVAEQLEVVPDNGIYVPYVCRTFFGFQLGDTLHISFESGQETFIIAGFTEDVLFGSRLSIAFDLPQNQFYALKEKAGEDANAAIVLIRAEGTIGGVSNKFSELIAEKGDELGFYSNSDIAYAEKNRSSNINIYVVILNIASLIGIIACFVVIGFHMRNTLDKDSKELGALKAIGYTGFRLVMTYVTQFLLLGLFGAMAGVAVSESIILERVKPIWKKNR